MNFKRLAILVAAAQLSLNGVLLAQIPFGEGHLIAQTTQDFPASAVTCDVNGDGIPDLVVGASHDNSVAWYENDGTGQLGEARLITDQAEWLYHIDACDLDCDGDMDILSASMDDDKFAWYENDGAGNFGPQQIIGMAEAGKAAIRIIPFDVDEDGDPDVITVSYIDGRISWYKNDGAGNLSEGETIDSGISSVDVVLLRDLDRDGRLDLLFGTSSLDPVIAWHRNRGGGWFSPANIIADYMGRVDNMEAFDMDGDGDTDIISSDRNEIYWFQNNGLGQFGDWKVTPLDGIEPASMTAFDVDGDGDRDVVMTSNGASNEMFWIPTYRGRFGSPQEIATDFFDYRLAHPCDMNGDGDLDIIAISSYGDKIVFHPNVGSGHFGQAQVQVSAGGGDMVVAHDLDGDGDLDVISASTEDGRIVWHDNDGHGTFSESTLIADQVTNVRYMNFADLNGDGIPDLSAAYGENLAWCRSDHFGQGLDVLYSEDLVRGGGSGDLDGDGDIDIVAAYSTYSQLVWQENDGTGGFTEHDINNGIRAYGACPCDLDNDGDYDVVVTGRVLGYYKTGWIANDGTGQFSEFMAISDEEMPPDWVGTADLDGDGDMDVLIASEYFNYIRWYENDGSGGFGDYVVLSENVEDPRSVHCCDLDQDGDSDILFASDKEHFIGLLENEGSGQFKALYKVADLMQAASVCSGDLDGDGDLDVLAAASQGDRVVWFENRTVISRVDDLSGRPDDFSLKQNYPNPFNPETCVSFSLQKQDHVTLAVYNAAGRKVTTLLCEQLPAGNHQVLFDAQDLPSGIYLCRINAAGMSRTIKMVLSR